MRWRGGNLLMQSIHTSYGDNIHVIGFDRRSIISSEATRAPCTFLCLLTSSTACGGSIAATPYVAVLQSTVVVLSSYAPAIL